MKKEWKVYIKGIDGMGNEVKQALVNLGAKECLTLSGSKDNMIYFIDHDGEIDYVDSESEVGKIIIDNYQQIKIPESWKEGDILISKDGACYKIFSESVPENINIFYGYNVSISVNGIITQYNNGVWVCDRKDYRLATSKEKAQFHKLLREHGKDWDADKRQFVKWIWKPEEGEPYWMINSNGTVDTYCWCDDPMDNSRFNFGNCFKTKKEAKAMAKTFNQLLKAEV